MPDLEQICCLHLAAAWGVMLLGILWGMVMGLFFHKAEWLGGYDSWRRRLLRLGHIACFGIGLLNLLFIVTLILVALFKEVDLETSYRMVIQAGSLGWLTALFTMPTVCALSAWKKAFRHLFFIPVTASILAISSTFYLTLLP